MSEEDIADLCDGRSDDPGFHEEPADQGEDPIQARRAAIGRLGHCSDTLHELELQLWVGFLEKMTAKDCRTCGACCAGGYADDGWADCTVEDVRRMSRHVRARLVTSSFKSGVEIGMAGVTPTSKYGACIFLRGTPGKRVSCRIYTTRPDVCRTFVPGSRRCQAARQEMLSNLTDGRPDASCEAP